jgi:chemotaxis protein methyltransferase CheR
LEFRQKVVPILKTYPFIKIWHAGCATGQEVYSMAILLAECGLLKRSTLYATDINVDALKCAQEGIYPLTDLKKYEENYRQAGGEFSLSNYYCNKYEYGKMNDTLKHKIAFSNHNMVTDGVFGEMNVIICRNVFIYFDKNLQEKVSLLFCESLVKKGFLCFGNSETIQYLDVANKFEVFLQKEKIFRKKSRIHS